MANIGASIFRLSPSSSQEYWQGEQEATAGQPPGPSNNDVATARDPQGEFKTLEKSVENVELPQQYMFRDSAPGMVSVKDKSMYRVVKHSSAYAETIIKLLGTLLSIDLIFLPKVSLLNCRFCPKFGMKFSPSASDVLCDLFILSRCMLT